MARIEYRYTVLLQPQPEGGFVVRVPALPEIVTEGETEDEAMRMAEDAIRLVVEYRRDHNEPIPEEIKPTMREVAVALSA